MSLRVVTLAALSALALLPGTTPAQSIVMAHGPDPLAEGARLRIRAASMHRGRIVGTVVRRTADYIVMDTMDVAAERRMFFPTTVLVTRERRLTLPLTAIDTLQVSAGRSRGRGMLRFATRAAAIGGIALGINYMSGTRHPSMRNFSEGFRTGSLLAATLAAPLGFHRGRERWTTVDGGGRPSRPSRPEPRDPRVIAESPR